jgi:osmotically-inducible protein OsmY
MTNSNSPLDALPPVAHRAPVLGTDGPVGTFAGVVRDPDTGQPAWVLVRQKRFFGLSSTTRILPAASVVEVAPNGVRLAVTGEEVSHSARLRNDAGLHTEVARGLAEEHKLVAFRFGIRVRVTNGVVTLEGNVRTPTQRYVAEQRVRTVPGVLAIRSRIIDDTTLAKAVASALAGEPETRQARLRVVSDLGRIHLTGDAASEAVRQRAIEVASSVPSVAAVEASTVRISAPSEQELEEPRGPQAADLRTVA